MGILVPQYSAVAANILRSASQNSRYYSQALPWGGSSRQKAIDPRRIHTTLDGSKFIEKFSPINKLTNPHTHTYKHSHLRIAVYSRFTTGILQPQNPLHHTAIAIHTLTHTLEEQRNRNLAIAAEKTINLTERGGYENKLPWNSGSNTATRAQCNQRKGEGGPRMCGTIPQSRSVFHFR